MKGRSKRQADRHYEAMNDAEVARIRASVPDAQPAIKVVGECAVCGQGIARFGNLGYTHIGPADHKAAKGD